MGIHKYKLKGHESFILREGWLTKGINAVSVDSKLFFVNSGADALGVGTNMAKSIRYWMRTSGLVVDSSVKGVSLTNLGKTIQEYDPYFEDIFTLWIVHSNIVCNFESATSWNLFFNHMDVASTFSRDEMQDLMKSLVIEYTGDENPSERSIKDDCSAILSMYSKSAGIQDDPEDKRTSPFEELGLVNHVGNHFAKKRPSYDKLDKLVVLYLIIDELNNNGSMQIDYLTEGENMPGKVLNLNRIAINDYLDSMQNSGYITVNRTAGLDIIYPLRCKKLQKLDIVKKYYDEVRKL